MKSFSPLRPYRLENHRRSSRFAGRTAGFLGALCLGLLGCFPSRGQNVTVAWNASTDPNVVGYNVYYGGASHQYTAVTSVNQPATNAAIPGLVQGATYYFAVTALDAFGMESGYSSEVSYIVPIVTASLKATAMPGGTFRLTITGKSGHTYQIQASTNLITWTTISTQVMGTNGPLTFTDSNAPKYRVRFYRTLGN